MMISMIAAAALFGAFAAEDGAVAAPAPAPVAQAPAAVVRVPAETQLAVELTETLSSKTAKLGQTFGFRLVEPLVVDGVELAPAGALGTGEVIDAKPSGLAGTAGKLVLAARRLELNGVSVRVRGLTFAASGDDRSDVSRNLSYLVGLPAFFIQGGEIMIPAGSRGRVKLAQAVDLPAPARAALPAPQPVADPASEPTVADAPTP